MWCLRYLPRYRAVGVDHGGGVVVVAGALDLEHRHDQHHPGLPGQRLHPLHGRAVRHRLGPAVVLGLLHLAEVRRVEDLLEAHDLRALLGRRRGRRTRAPRSSTRCRPSTSPAGSPRAPPGTPPSADLPCSLWKGKGTPSNAGPSAQAPSGRVMTPSHLAHRGHGWGVAAHLSSRHQLRSVRARRAHMGWVPGALAVLCLGIGRAASVPAGGAPPGRRGRAVARRDGPRHGRDVLPARRPGAGAGLGAVFVLCGAWFAALRSAAARSTATRATVVAGAAMLFMLVAADGAAADGHGGHAAHGGGAAGILGVASVVALVLTAYFVWHTLRCADRLSPPTGRPRPRPPAPRRCRPARPRWCGGSHRGRGRCSRGGWQWS